jgi:hypothetical protein
MYCSTIKEETYGQGTCILNAPHTEQQHGYAQVTPSKSLVGIELWKKRNGKKSSLCTVGTIFFGHSEFSLSPYSTI